MTKQYYYANHSDIEQCWHDEGTGPWPHANSLELYSDLAGSRMPLHWRDKPVDKPTWPVLQAPFDYKDRPPTVDDADHNRNVQTFHHDIGAWCVQRWEFAREHKLPWYHTPLYFTEFKRDRVLREVADAIVIICNHDWEDNDFREKADSIRERLERIETLLRDMKNEK